jgi:hypothetical protein
MKKIIFGIFLLTGLIHKNTQTHCAPHVLSDTGGISFDWTLQDLPVNTPPVPLTEVGLIQKIQQAWNNKQTLIPTKRLFSFVLPKTSVKNSSLTTPLVQKAKKSLYQFLGSSYFYPTLLGFTGLISYNLYQNAGSKYHQPMNDVGNHFDLALPDMSILQNTYGFFKDHIEKFLATFGTSISYEAAPYITQYTTALLPVLKKRAQCLPSDIKECLPLKTCENIFYTLRNADHSIAKNLSEKFNISIGAIRRGKDWLKVVCTSYYENLSYGWTDNKDVFDYEQEIKKITSGNLGHLTVVNGCKDFLDPYQQKSLEIDNDAFKEIYQNSATVTKFFQENTVGVLIKDPDRYPLINSCANTYRDLDVRYSLLVS